MRTDPERARELLLEFADFTRYSFRRHGEFTTLAEELRSVERYLLLEQARFGDRLAGDAADRARGAAGRRAVPVHPAAGRERRTPRAGRAGGRGRITIVAQRPRPGVRHQVEDDGVGEDPEKVRRALAGDAALDSVGLGNVDARLRNAYGDEYGLVVETAPGAGTKVIVRVPEVRPGSARMNARPCRLKVLVVDDERPALDELVYLLARGPARRRACSPATRRPRRCALLQDREVDAVFLDIQMPGLTGLELARVLARFRTRRRSCSSPPTRSTRSTRSSSAPSTTCSSRCAPSGSPRRSAGWSTAPAHAAGRDDEPIPVELGGVTRFVQRSDIRYVEAQGDYARLHTADGATWSASR